MHQNVHQRIKKDRIGYVRIGPDSVYKCLQISHLYSDSDPRLQTQVSVIGAFGKKGVSDFQQRFQQIDCYGTFLLM